LLEKKKMRSLGFTWIMSDLAQVLSHTDEMVDIKADQRIPMSRSHHPGDEA